jgi:hypothetical protein
MKGGRAKHRESVFDFSVWIYVLYFLGSGPWIESVW